MGGADDGIWVFAYGSLMWRPNFPHVDARRALLRGYHRALCVYSVRYRGTHERPGLVLGLDRGGSCRGRALRVAAENVDAVTAYLNGRELVTGVYAPKFVNVRLEGGESVPAYVFLARRDHEQYAGKLPPERTAELLVKGRGLEGSGLEYLRNTIVHLDQLGIPDGPLHRILALAEAKAEKRS